jgi:uncharacterized protein (UPF0218 family)
MSNVSKAKVPAESSHMPKKDENVIRLLTSDLRKELKKPQGQLIVGSFEETMKRLKEVIETEKPSLVVSVGDVVSRNMIEYDVPLNVLIVDNKVMRRAIQPLTVDADQTLFARNPAGAITDEAWAAIRRAVEQKGKTRVVVDGEEDLLTIPVVLSVPQGAIVVYGQPHKGLVVVKVTEETKERMRQFVDDMEQTSKS